MNLRRLIFQRAVHIVSHSGRVFRCKEEFAQAFGIGAWAIGHLPPLSDKDKNALGPYVKTRRCGRVPLLKDQDVICLHQNKYVTIRGKQKKPVSIVCKQELLCYAFVMPDNKMQNDGICKGDIIVAAENIRYGHDDLVICRIPGCDNITVRRFSSTSIPGAFDLTEYNGENPLMVTERNDAIFGVVLEIDRDYHPVNFEKYEAAK